MNKNITIAAIAMFAATLGLGMIAPAMATNPHEEDPHKEWICHFQEEEWVDLNEDGVVDEGEIIPASWETINVDNASKKNGHFIGGDEENPRHIDPESGMGDFVMLDENEDGLPDGDCPAVEAPIEIA